MNNQYLENSRESDALEEDVAAERDRATNVHVPDTMPIIPLRNTVFFPHQLMPLSVGREGSIRIVKEAVQNRSPIVLLAQKDPAVDKPTASDVHWFGTVGNLLKVFNLSDGSKNVIIQGIHRVRVLSFLEEGPAMRAIVQQVEDVGEIDVEGEALGTNIRNLFKQAVELSPDLTSEHLSIVLNMKDPGRVADVITSLINVSVAEKQQILESFNIKARLERAHFLLSKFVQRLEIGSKIQAEVQDEINKSQRDYYLREQLKAIQRELGEDTENVDIRELREQIKQAQLPEEVGKVADKELSRLSRMHSSSAEYTVSRTYLEWLLDLPWSKSTADNLNIVDVREALERDHYGLEKIKKRILEYLAVRKLKAEQEGLQATPRGPILCFVGPPGVGKTSLGRSIANAIGRKFVRISLGGIHDEAEIRGHRRTYIGALPGRILLGLKKADSNNPVFMLDEVDKIGMDFRGDPSSALLEVLDSEQNFSFSDHYVEIPFDLSRVMFIATANTIDPIPSALRDRMEIIEIPSYTEDEKLNIAKRFLV
ncbi:MAG: LON peptidase substrate-binding domain-containing protein, partial [Bacteroidota bacterium]